MRRGNTLGEDTRINGRAGMKEDGSRGKGSEGVVSKTEGLGQRSGCLGTCNEREPAVF